MPKYTRPRTRDHPNFPLKNGLEDTVAESLQRFYEPNRPMTYFYEKYKLPYTLPPTFYRPDFVLPNGIILEVKGYFEPHDRKKHLLIKEQYPDLDIRFVFSNPKLRLNRTTLKTYGDWCRHHGFLYTRRTVPIEWLEEPSLKARKNAVVRCLQRRQSGERDDEASDDYGGTR